jgi:cytochrome b6-f complex iron-sulfur subunit
MHPVRSLRRPLPDGRPDDGTVLRDGGIRPSAPTSPGFFPPGTEARLMTRPASRRDVLCTLGVGAGLAALGAEAVASLRSLVPNVSYDAPTTVKIGLPKEFPDGLSYLPEERLFVFRDGKTFHAVSAVCTHLGCTVRAEALPRPRRRAPGGVPLRTTYRFLCPCHGSRYDSEGNNVAGPAPRPLAWYRLTVAPDDGQLVADLAREVPHDFRLTLA